METVEHFEFSNKREPGVTDRCRSAFYVLRSTFYVL